MSKTLLVLALLCAAVYCGLFTARQANKTLGYHPKGQLPPFSPLVNDVSTSCFNVPLQRSPYNYDGIVKSGYLSVGRGSSALAFIFYGKMGAKESDVKKYPTIIWLNGGPGSSSQLGNFLELGPYWIQEDDATPYKIIRNNNTWVQDYNVLFVDQPVGTGLSYADERIPSPFTYSMDDVANDFYNALHALYIDGSGCFNSLGISPEADLFVFGESYAGKYVPAIGAKILKEKQNGGFLKGLKGIAIGDGFTHPPFILSEVGGFVYNLGLLDYQQRARVEQKLLNATYQWRGQHWEALHDTFDEVLDQIVEWNNGINVYDFTSYTDYPTQLLTEYFSDPDVKALFNLSNEITFNSQGGKVYQAMYRDFMMPYVDLVEYCLLQDLPVLIYNGQNDIIVENPGTMRWVEMIHYKDAHQFRNTLFKTWKVDGKVAGSMKAAGKLEFRIVNNAGHLVPMDQGKNALEMVRQFVEPNRSK